MPTDNDHVIARLRHAISDSRNHPVAYPFLARHGLMETTPAGFVAIDPAAVVSRTNELIARLGGDSCPFAHEN